LTRPAESVRVYDDDEIYQIELVCYSSKPTADRVSGLWVGNLTDAQLRPVADFVRWLRSKGEPIQIAWPGRRALSYSEANAAGFRFTRQEFYNWPGLLGHQHVPENTHWDPGAFPWERLIRLIGGNDMSHPAESFNEYVAGHDIGEVPSWSPWDQYVAAGGSSVRESGTWAFTRADAAWFWSRWIVPLQSKIGALESKLDALEARLAAVESGGGNGGGIVLETDTIEVVRSVRVK
jgi:hypothetical protein